MADVKRALEKRPRLTIIEDSMPSEDAFGPHTRLAELLGNHIIDAGRSGAIGLQGSWGSGKSAVIHFLCNMLPALDKASDQKTNIFVFDAWAHEGDELRRSFLDELNQSIHLDEDTRASSQESIWQVKETVTAKTSHTLTMGALGCHALFACALGL